MNKEEAKAMAKDFAEIACVYELIDDIHRADEYSRDANDWLCLVIRAVGKDTLLEALTNYKDEKYKMAKITIANIGL